MVDLENGQMKARERGEGGDRGGERGWFACLFCLLLSGNTQNDSNFKPVK